VVVQGDEVICQNVKEAKKLCKRLL